MNSYAMMNKDGLQQQGGGGGAAAAAAAATSSSPDTTDGPWIMTFDNFLDDFEVEQLLHGASYGEGFQRSSDCGKIILASGEMVKVTSKTRTSSNAWCRTECENLPGVKRVEEVRV